MFYPLQDRPWLVVVAGDPARPATYRAFRAEGRQGVNSARGVWHHPLLVLSADERFLVVDRGDGPGPPANNLDEVWLSPEHDLELATP
jgi:ureidoglycolate lyase